jgi:hypothetical protein
MLLPDPMTPAIEAVLQIAPRAAHRGMGAAERPDQVGRQDRRPEILGQRVEIGKRDRCRCGRGPRIVNQKIEPAQAINRARHHPLGMARPRHVARRGDDSTALGFEPFDRSCPARIVGQVVQCHRRAAAREDLHSGEADARGRAGNQRRITGEICTDHVAPSAEIGVRPSMPPLRRLSSRRRVGNPERQP